MKWYHWTLIASLILIAYAIISYVIWWHRVGKYLPDDEDDGFMR